MDHGQVATTVETDMGGVESRLAELAELGIDLDTITAKVLDEGVAAFAKSFDGLITSIADKREKFLHDSQQVPAGLGS